MRLVVALFALLVFATPASASWQQDRALAIAKVVWHNPCVDRAKFVQVDQTTIDGETDVAPGDSVAARADKSTCTIEFGTFFGPEVTDWWLWCAIVIHESGHLAGFHDPTNVADPDHSLSPSSIMYRTVDFDARCAGRGRPYLEAHGALAPIRRGR